MTEIFGKDKMEAYDYFIIRNNPILFSISLFFGEVDFTIIDIMEDNIMKWNIQYETL